MANKKKNVYKPKPMTEKRRELIQGLLEEYDIESADDILDDAGNLFFEKTSDCNDFAGF
ncbi:MAG: hypothetical protein ACOYJJ_05900 [Anaerovoracaceae bacterium]|jgi:hypothetical protein